MRYEISADRSTLTLTVDDAERAILRELPDEGERNIHTDAAMYDFFESFTCNCELNWVYPDRTGDLTDAPMLGIYGTPSANEDFPVAERWAWMSYQVRSLLVELRDKGRAELTGGKLTPLVSVPMSEAQRAKIAGFESSLMSCRPLAKQIVDVFTEAVEGYKAILAERPTANNAKLGNLISELEQFRDSLTLLEREIKALVEMSERVKENP